MVARLTGLDPRQEMDGDVLDEANRYAMPRVRMGSGMSPGFWMGVVGVGLLGVLTFTSLANSRSNAARYQPPGVQPTASLSPRPLQSNSALVPVRPSTVPAPLIPPGGIKPVVPPSARMTPIRSVPVPMLPVSSIMPPSIPVPSLAMVAAQKAMDARLQSPAVVIDLTKGTAAGQTATPGAPGTPGAGQPGAQGSADDRFSARIAGEDAAPAKAQRLSSMSDVVPQGAVMSGVLETAINSDLPGYVRAVVSTDVTGFDGRKILIPKGSRLIGQYRSGLAAGEKRAFVIWQRVMRPDGVSVQLTSPGTDTLGRAGLAGKVDTHFFRRFGSAILLSVIDGGLGALANSGSSGTVVISSAGQARNVAGSVLERDLQIPPTVKVAQGTPIRIFIARDLDFSSAGGVPVR